MDLSIIYQLRTKRFWWMDVIFYFAISLLIATLFSYIIFLAKNAMQRSDIKAEVEAMQSIGTDEQKRQENQVIGYQRKIRDFSDLLKNHQFASYAFAFMQTQTMPNIWYNQFDLNRSSAEIKLSGEAENLDALSRQLAILEKNKYVKNIGGLSTAISESGRFTFNYSLSLDPVMFDAGSEMAKVLEKEEEPELPEEMKIPEEEKVQVGSDQKIITSFRLLLEPEVVGLINQEEHTILLEVPPGTDVKSLVPAIVTSPGATVFPESHVIQDFTNPVVYTVVAQDGSLQAYQVAVKVLSSPQGISQTELQRKSGSSLLVIIVFVIILIITVLILFFAIKKIKAKKSEIL